MANNQKHIVDSLALLNTEQKRAVTSKRKRVLVLAGAGSGKTKTLLQKIVYLIQEQKVKPEHILAITFTKNAATEMIDRLLLSTDTSGNYQNTLNDTGLNLAQKRFARLQKIKEQKWIAKLTIRTFHSFCYSILKSYGAKEFDNKFKLLTDNANGDSDLSKLSAEETQMEVLHKMLILSCEDPSFLLIFKRYVIDYLVDKLHSEPQDRDLKYEEGRFYTSLRGDKVRSKSEQYICDWLYRHNINYEYEPEVFISDFSFTPDFYIPDANLYLEHISSKSASMVDKEQEFSISGKTLVKTYEPMTHDTNLFNLALTRIVKGRLPATFDFQKSLNYEEELKGRHAEVKDFLKQTLRILDMIQVDHIAIDKLSQAIEHEPHERVRLFYKCCLPMLLKYKDYCINKSYLDFNELVNRCITLVENDPIVKGILHEKYKNVLVDEFQDVNKIQIKLIKTIMNPDSQLFCVGDDWQSIYGFRGSDVRFIVEFSKFFKDGQVIQLNKNYRSTKNIVTASNEVIKNNKFKIEKDLKSTIRSNKKIEVYAGVNQKDNIDFAVQEVRELLSKGINAEDILFLYRRNKMYSPYADRFRKEKLKVTGRTIHAAKGLESKVVFIIGLTEGSGGFPDIWMEDRIYQVLRPTQHDLLLEEERRLFYVALTRSQKYLYLITELGNESSFIDEIPSDCKIIYSVSLSSVNTTTTKCGKCKKKVDKYYRFCPHCGFGID